jgi:hypothetical protein
MLEGTDTEVGRIGYVALTPPGKDSCWIVTLRRWQCGSSFRHVKSFIDVKSSERASAANCFRFTAGISRKMPHRLRAPSTKPDGREIRGYSESSACFGFPLQPVPRLLVSSSRVSMDGALLICRYAVSRIPDR